MGVVPNYVGPNFYFIISLFSVRIKKEILAYSNRGRTRISHHCRPLRSLLPESPFIHGKHEHTAHVGNNRRAAKGDAHWDRRNWNIMLQDIPHWGKTCRVAARTGKRKAWATSSYNASMGDDGGDRRPPLLVGGARRRRHADLARPYLFSRESAPLRDRDGVPVYTGDIGRWRCRSCWSEQKAAGGSIQINRGATLAA